VGIQNLTKVRINKEAVFGKKINTKNRFGDCGQNEGAKKGACAEVQSSFDGSP
jgi:hypothetical protein